MKGIVDEEIIKKAGGRFSLSVLLQKRMRQFFMSGDANYDRGKSALERALQEIRDGRIWLDSSKDEPKETEETEDEDASVFDELDELLLHLVVYDISVIL